MDFERLRIYCEPGFSFRGAVLLWQPFKSPHGGFGGCSDVLFNGNEKKNTTGWWFQPL